MIDSTEERNAVQIESAIVEEKHCMVAHITAAQRTSERIYLPYMT